ncbi:MAG: penicillin-insensitive murein endopeptidase [Pseudomonadota bacterium]
MGHHGRGVLRHGVELPNKGDGYVIPPKWRVRKRNYGTKELVQLIVRAARRVNWRYPKSVLGIADLSTKGGGPLLPEHRSHHNGRDVDLIFYTTNLKGRPLIPKEMIRFDSSGKSLAPDSPEQKLDVPRTWELVKTLITDPFVDVQWIFVDHPIAQMLLHHAQKTNEPRQIVERATTLMLQPSDASSHSDHMHVRIYCSASDRSLGCIDRGPPPSFERTSKHPENWPAQPQLPDNFWRSVGMFPRCLSFL